MRIAVEIPSAAAPATSTGSRKSDSPGAPDRSEVMVRAAPGAVVLQRILQSAPVSAGTGGGPPAPMSSAEKLQRAFGPPRPGAAGAGVQRMCAQCGEEEERRRTASRASPGRVQRQVPTGEAACGAAFKREFLGRINDERPEAHNGVPRMYYAKIPGDGSSAGQPVEGLVAGTQVEAGQRAGYAGLWRTVCVKTSKMPTQILWALDDYVTNLDEERRKAEAKKKEPAAPPETAAEPVSIPEPAELRGFLAALRAEPSGPPLSPGEVVDRLLEILKDVDLSDPATLQHVVRAVGPRGPDILAELMRRVEERLVLAAQGEPAGMGALGSLQPTHPYFYKGGVGLFPFTGAAFSPLVQPALKVVDSAAAFIQGLIEGLLEKLAPEDIEALGSKLAQSSMLNVVAPSVFAAGAVVGILRDLAGTIDFIVSFTEVVSSFGAFLEDLLSSAEQAREMGKAIGAEYAAQIAAMAQKNVFTFTYRLGELVGPTVVYTVLSLLGIPEAAMATILPRIEAVLRKAKGLGKLGKLLRGRHRPRGSTPDAPGGKHAPHKRPDVDADVPKVTVPGVLCAACRIGSLLCDTIPKVMLDKVDPYPHSQRVAMPKGPFRLRGKPDPDYEDLRRLTGEQLQRVYLGDPKRWSPEFRAQWKKLNPGVDESKAVGSIWPDEGGKAWQVHHRKPLDFGGDNATVNLVALEPSIHVKFTGWWASLKAKFRAEFSPSDWKAIKGGDIDETFP